MSTSSFLDKTIDGLNSKGFILEYILDSYNEHNIVIDANNALEVVKYLNSELGYNFLVDLTGSHYPDKENQEYQVVFHIQNLVENTRLRFKSNLSKGQMEFPSLTPVFSASNWMERETFDFFGIQFTGHPDLRRILNVDDMDYHPMRKEYALEDETRRDKNDTFFGR
jgi:NADH-quinone oxidoreductase subunit C